MVVAFERQGQGPQGAVDPSPAAGFGHETTRYLCAAAYLDGGFREKVIARGKEAFRAWAPEVGVDVGMVTDHCRQARRSKVIRDLIIVAIVAVFIVITLSTARQGPVDTAVSRAGPLTLMASAACWLAVVAVTIVEAFRRDGVLRGKLTRDAFYRQTPQPDPQKDDGNVIVYSGFSPFVGSGSDLGGWSFAIDLERGKSGVTAQTPRTFDLADLYRSVSDAFEGLRIPNLRLSRKLFVNGRTIRGERLFLPDVHRRPVQSVDEAVVARYAAGSSKSVRHYLCAQTVDWNGELAVTLFIRFQTLSTKLFVELSAFLLPPLKPEYYAIDKLHPRMRFQDGLGILILAVVKAQFLPLWAPIASLGRLQTWLGAGGQDKELRRQIDEDLLFDYGATSSLRELATGTAWRFYFQKLDKEMHHKILQQQLLDSLVDFLDDHGVDTSEIKERTVHILNNGVIVSGGSLSADGMAVGQGAQAKVTNTVRRAREKVAA